MSLDEIIDRYTTPKKTFSVKYSPTPCGVCGDGLVEEGKDFCKDCFEELEAVAI